MFKAALRQALMKIVAEHAPSALTDAYGGESIQIYFESVAPLGDARAETSQWSVVRAVAVLYSLEDTESLAHRLSLIALKLEAERGGLRASGTAKFKELTEGILRDVAVPYAELRFEIYGEIAPA